MDDTVGRQGRGSDGYGLQSRDTRLVGDWRGAGQFSRRTDRGLVGTAPCLRADESGRDGFDLVDVYGHCAVSAFISANCLCARIYRHVVLWLAATLLAGIVPYPSSFFGQWHCI